MADLRIEPEEQIAGVRIANLLRNLDETSYNEGADELACRLNDCKAVIEALLSERVALRTEAQTISPMCARKTNDIMARDDYEKSGYVLRKAGADICVSEGGAVAWFTPNQWQWLMFGRMHTTFDWPKPPVYEIHPAPGDGGKHGQS